MPVSCKLQKNKYRLCGPDGKPEMNKAGTPIDGGGHETMQLCMRQARAVNRNLKMQELRDRVFSLGEKITTIHRE